MDELRFKTIEIDLCGAMLTQGDLDRIAARVASADDCAGVTITIKHITIHGFPRLLVDYGDLIYRMAKRLDEIDK